MTGDELPARRQLATQGIQHAAQFVYQLKRGSSVGTVAETKLSAQYKLRIELCDRSLSVRNELDEFTSGVACLTLCNVRWY